MCEPPGGLLPAAGHTCLVLCPFQRPQMLTPRPPLLWPRGLAGGSCWQVHLPGRPREPQSQAGAVSRPSALGAPGPAWSQTAQTGCAGASSGLCVGPPAARTPRFSARPPCWCSEVRRLGREITIGWQLRHVVIGPFYQAKRENIRRPKKRGASFHPPPEGPSIWGRSMVAAPRAQGTQPAPSKDLGS